MTTTLLSQPRVITETSINHTGAASLKTMAPGQQGTIESVPPMGLLPELGVRCGKRLSVIAHNIAGGPIVVQADRRLIAIDRCIAAQIMVRLSD